MARLITAQASKIKDPTQREAFTSTIYDGIIQRLRVSVPSPFSSSSALLSEEVLRQGEREHHEADCVVVVFRSHSVRRKRRRRFCFGRGLGRVVDKLDLSLLNMRKIIDT